MKLKAKKIKKLLVPKYEFRDNRVLEDPKGLLAALQQAQQTRRHGFANRLHLTPLDVYAAGEQYPDDMSDSDIPEANWQARDDDPGMTTDAFLLRCADRNAEKACSGQCILPRNFSRCTARKRSHGG